MNALMLNKSAFIPIVMSLTALAIVCVQVSVFGVVRRAQQGAPVDRPTAAQSGGG
ncbi:MAG: hypothetical protein ACYDCJ_11570 [Gammaproteobacteria bacterium]